VTVLEAVVARLTTEASAGVAFFEEALRNELGATGENSV